MKKTKNTNSIDDNLVEISGSTENYLHDMSVFLNNAKEAIQALRSTKSGRQKLRIAGLK